MGYHQFEKRPARLGRLSRGSQFPRPARSVVKRAIDVIGASIGLIVFSPFILPMMLVIRLTDGGESIFAHERIGYEGKSFKCYKLRSMASNSEERLEQLFELQPELREQWEIHRKLDDDPRITPLGKFLRKSSLDELPQLVNVLRGDMSLVGPRPIVKEEIPKYASDFIYYTDVRPGLTGLWQVSGRSNTTYDERVAMDVRYVREWSNANDLKVIAKTIPAILSSKGAR